MNTLLKDLPEHKERIENNFQLSAEIKDLIDDRSDYSETRGGYVLDAEYFEKVSIAILEKITDFVNENYEWKGIKA